MNGNNRGLIIAVIVILILILGGVLIYANANNMADNETPTVNNDSIYNNGNSQTEGLENNNSTSSTTASTTVNTNVSGSVTY